MDSCELHIRLAGIGDNKTIDDAFGYGFCHGVTEVALDLHRRNICISKFHAIANIAEDRTAEVVEMHRGCTDNVRGPSIDQFIKLRGCVLFSMQVKN